MVITQVLHLPNPYPLPGVIVGEREQAKKKEKKNRVKRRKERKKKGHRCVSALYGMPRGMSYQKYIHSKWWASLRDEKLERDGYRCHFCAGRARQCHHVRYPKDYSDDRLANLRSCCQGCHKEEHDRIRRNQPQRKEQYRCSMIGVGAAIARATENSPWQRKQ